MDGTRDRIIDALKALEGTEISLPSNAAETQMGEAGNERPQKRRAEPRRSGLAAAAVRAMSAISGVEPAGVAADYWLNTLLFPLLLVLLGLYVGWVNYSTDAGAIFSSQGFVAYVTAFLRGLSSEALNKTLQNITFGR